MTLLVIALGAALGAPCRYLVDLAVQARHDSAFPWGTLAVNVVGSYLLGVLATSGPHLNPLVTAALGVGFCGAFTTYSTFSYETLRLLESRATTLAAANAVTSVLAGLGAAALGWTTGRLL